VAKVSTEIGFKEGGCVKCSFIKEFADDSKIYLLNYVDDMLYHGTDAVKVQEFETQLGKRFQLELLGNAHWYLGSRINQLKNFDIELDQSKYCKAIVKRYLDTAGCTKITRRHDAPLPSGFIATVDDCSASEDESQQLSEGFNIDFASCIGSLIYLSMTRTDIIYAVKKLAKFTCKPGKVHFEALLHLLRYLRDNSLYGVRFYSNLFDAPIYQMLLSQNIEESHPFLGSRIPHGMMTQIMDEALVASSSPIWGALLITAQMYQILWRYHQPKLNIMKVALPLWLQAICGCCFVNWREYMMRTHLQLPCILIASLQ
jgi:hypothetical protein